MRNYICFLLCALGIPFAGLAQDFNASMAEIMTNMKAYTLDMLDRMPDDLWDYRPTDSVRTFQEQVSHTLSTQYFLFHYFLLKKGEGDPSEVILEARGLVEDAGPDELQARLAGQLDELVAFYDRAGQDLYKEKYNFGTPEEPDLKDYFAASMLIRDHLSHHRAQLILYLRLNGLVPAPYQGF